MRLQSNQSLNNGQYLVFSGAIASSISFLKDQGLKEVLPDPICKEQREAFLRSYLEIVDVMADQNGHDLQWWATDIASKNRFKSPLPGLLSDFARCLRGVETMKGQGQFLVLVQPPWPVVCALESLTRTSEWDFRVLSWPWSRFLARWRGKAKRFVVIFKECLSSVLRIWEARRYFGPFYGKRVGERPVYLIKSFLYESSFTDDARYQDPFFGNLAEFLSENCGGSVDILTVVVSFGNRAESLKKMRTAKGNPVVPLELFLCCGDVFKASKALLCGRFVKPFRISGPVSFLGHEIGTLIKECLASGGWEISLYQYLHLAAGLRISEIVKPFACALTFEGNPWERMFIAGLRRPNSQLPVFGYQHSVVPKSAAGVFIGPGEEKKSPLPTCVLTTGEIPASIIRDYGALSEVTVEPACALRYEYLYDIDYQEKTETQEGPLVLVALEGVWGVLPLLEYVLDWAPGCLDFRFRIRAHPGLPLSKLLRKLGKRIIPGGNVEASLGGTVASDVEDSSAVLYWGTTVALEALMMGKPLIHFDRGDFLSYDPLFEFDDFKWRVRKNQDLKSVLEEIRRLPEERNAILRERGRNYIRSYFHEVDDNSMSKFLP